MLFLIAMAGLLLRLSFINKPEGLWNDEYVSWYVANTPFHEDFWQEVLKQCHMPLYYLYLKPFAHCSDLILRLTSVVPSVLAIFLMYFVGKVYSKKLGIICATLTSFLSFLIYYSQEVRFYSLLFLFSALALLATIKLVKNTNRKNIVFYCISMLLILLTHVLGGIFVLFNTLYVIYKKQCFSKKILLPVFVGSIVVLPFGLNIIRMLPTSQWWGHFSYTNILFLFSDYLSPILTNNINAPTVFFYNKSFALWQFLPCLISATPLLLGIKKAKGLSVVALLTVIVMSILAIFGKIVFITKYSIEILPIIIFLLALGFDKLKKVGNALLSLFVLIHLCAFFTPNYVTKTIRYEGNRIPAEIIKARNPENVIFTYYEPNRFERYVDLSKKKVYYISKINRLDYLSNPAEILQNIKTGETVSVVFLDSVSFFDEDFINANRENAKIPEMFMTFSHIKNSLIAGLNKDFTDFNVDKIGSWTVVSCKKK